MQAVPVLPAPSDATAPDTAALAAAGVHVLLPEVAKSLNPKIVLGDNTAVGGGKGLFAGRPIAKGEAIWVEHDDLISPTWTTAEIDAMPDAAKDIMLHFCYNVDHEVVAAYPELADVPLSEWSKHPPSDHSMYMNHSCDPTAWFLYPNGLTKDCDHMTAIRDIAIGEEITFDYATSECHSLYRGFECSCGAKACRGRMHKDAWRDPEVQTKYAGHFLRHVAENVAKLSFSDRYGYKVMECEDKDMGSMLMTSVHIPEGELAMVLPANALVDRERLMDAPNGALQVSDTLWSASLTPLDYDNFLQHSCAANLRGVILEDLTLHLYANRGIEPGEPLTIDYEAYEDDLLFQGVDFRCGCGAAACRGHIVGKVQRELMYPGAICAPASAGGRFL